MPKSVEDIIVPERRKSIRDIPIPEGRRRTTSFTPPISHTSPNPDPIKAAREVFSVPSEKRFTKKSRKGMWLGIIVALVIIIFALLSLFNTSTFSYIPKSQVISFDSASFVAKKTGEGGLLYSVVKVSKDLGIDVPASGQTEVNRKASGTIVVYNNATVEPQELIATTRFETPNGLVYRAPNKFVIPGKKTVAGVVQPGSVEIVVEADKGGEEYNVGLSDFTLPGLAGTSRFSTIYARSKTVMSGGFVGMEKAVSENDTAQAKTQLETMLRNALTSDAVAQVPEDFVLIPLLSTITFESLPQTTSLTEGSARVNMRGNLYGVMFKRTDLAKYLTSDQIKLASDEELDIENFDSLKFSFTGALPTDILSSDEIKFSVAGQAKAVWQTDEVALKADLAGKNKRDIPSILNNYSGIVSATPMIRPFWRSSFPSNASSIKVVQLPAE